MIDKKQRITLQPINQLYSLNRGKISEQNTRRSFNLKPKPKFSLQLPPTAPIRTAKESVKRKSQRPPINKKTKIQPINFDHKIIAELSIKSRGRIPTASQQGLSRQALFQRKESHLNTYFNQRRDRLKSITKENKLIYVKINSQKSLYSSRQLNKSYQSNCSISRRLSQSKLSSRSRQSITSSRHSRQAKTIQPPKQTSIRFESHDINKVQRGQMQRYLNIFCNNVNLNQTVAQKIKYKQTITPQPRQKENYKQMTKLEQIVQEISHKPKNKNNFVLNRIF